MNYFELYPGDYLRDTTRLNLTEHGAYLRLLMTYYAEEEPLPADLDELYVIAGAIKPADKEAVRKVADRFFPVGKDGQRHNGRADEEIAKAAERMEGADERKSNDAERKRRSRERRSAMFAALREVGVVPHFDVTMTELSELVAANVTRDVCVTLGVTPRDESRTVTRDGTATRPQTPDPTRKATAGTPHTTCQTSGVGITAAGDAAAALNRAGIRCTSQNPNLLAAIEEGVTTAALVEFAELYPNKPAGYVIAAARRQLAERATSNGATTHAASQPSRRLSAVERVEANIRAARAESGPGADGDVIEGQAVRVVG